MSKPLTMDEAAKFLQISKSHLYKLTSQGRVPHHKPTGKKIYFFEDELIEYVKGNWDSNHG